MSTCHCGSNDEIVGSPQEMPLEASSSTESICVTRRSVTNPKRLFISIPRNDSLNDTYRSGQSRKSYGGKEEASSVGLADSVSNLQVPNLSASMVVQTSGSDLHRTKAPTSPRREAFTSEIRDSLSSLIRDERDVFRTCAFEMLDIIGFHLDGE